MWFRRSSNLSQAPDAKFMAKLRADLLRHYSKRQSDKLAGKGPVNLRKISADIGVSGEVMTLKAEQVSTAMFNLFVEGRGRLLLSGVPGAGKTTLLLQLAEAQLNSPHKELPVLLNLASWRSSFKNLDEWLAEVLYLELSTNRVGADQVRQTIPLILLLDGLDEVPESDRSSCLAAIGEYGADANRQFAVSCRKEELKALEEFIPTNIYLPIEVAQLTPEQIETQLLAWSFIQPEAKPLLQAIRQDAPLLEAMRTPFFLNTAQLLFASGKRWEQFEFSKTEDVKVRETELLERFITKALNPGWRNHSAAQVEHWLSFLASRMNREGLVVFELTNLQPRWLSNLKNLVLFLAILSVAVSLLSGLIFGLLAWVYNGYDSGIIWFKWSFFVLLCVLFPMLFIEQGLGTYLSKKYKPSNLIKGDSYKQWSWKSFFTNLKQEWSMFFSMLFWMSAAILYFEAEKHLELSLKIALSFIFLSLLQKGFERKIFIKINTPYQRFNHPLHSFNQLLWHFMLRLTLYFERSMPLRLIHFLDDITLRHLMETDDGATWRFRHRMVQEYFANKWKGE